MKLSPVNRFVNIYMRMQVCIHMDSHMCLNPFEYVNIYIYTLGYGGDREKVADYG